MSEAGSGLELTALAEGGVDMTRLKARFDDRLQTTSTNQVALPYDDALQSAMGNAAAHALKQRDGIMTLVVFHYALETEDNPIVPVIRELGGDVQRVQDWLKRLVP